MKVSVDKIKLINILKANKEEHIQIFEEAMVGYKAEIIAYYQNVAESVRLDFNQALNISDYDKPKRPQSHANEYTNVLELLALSDGEFVELDSSSFRQYVKDEWSWGHDFYLTTSKWSDLSTRKLGSLFPGNEGV